MKKLTKKYHEVIEKIASEHCHRTFGYLTSEDLKSEIWLICIEALSEFDKDMGPLENFLRKTVKNRLVNRFKVVTKSVRSPCPRCPFYDPSKSIPCTKYDVDTEKCNKWRNYQLSIQSRNSLINASESLHERCDTQDSSVKTMAKEIIQIVRSKINPSLLNDFNRLVEGEKISKVNLRKISDEVIKIVGE